jgi:hypothetical protein
MTNHEQKKELMKEVRILDGYINLALENGTDPKQQWIDRRNEIYFNILTLYA